jgi:hypothetical protein
MTGGATPSVSLTFPPRTFSSTPLERTCPAALALVPDEMAAHPAGPDGESLRACTPGNLPRGQRPLFPSSHADRGFAGHRRATTSPLRLHVQSPCAESSLPLHHLDWGATPRGRASAGHPPTRIGVFPFLGLPLREEERRVEVGRGKEERGGEAAPMMPPVRQDRRPHQSPRGRKGPSTLGRSRTGARTRAPP